MDWWGCGMMGCDGWGRKVGILRNRIGDNGKGGKTCK